MPAQSDPRLPSPGASLLPQNPYAPPASGAAPPPPPAPDHESSLDGVRPFGGTLKWIYAGAAVAAHAPFVVGLVTAQRVAVLVMGLLAGLGFVVGMVSALAWLAAAWGARPFPRAHRDVSAGGAVGRLFIPFYGALYWMFAANLELAASVDRFAWGNRSGRGPFDLANIAMAAGALQIVGALANFLSLRTPSTGALAFAALVGVARQGAWLLFMVKWERSRALVAS